MDGELSKEQRELCEEIKENLERDGLGNVIEAIYAGEDRCLASEEFPRLLRQAGFAEVTSWALPDARRFAESLEADQILPSLGQDDPGPFIRALVRAARRYPGWLYQWVTCRKA